MRFYLAARFSRRLELRGYRNQLDSFGHRVTSRWLDVEEVSMDELTWTQRDHYAHIDLDDVRDADCLIVFTEERSLSVPGAERGGRFVEMGYALGLGKPIVIVGPRENIFCFLAQGVTQFEDFPELVDALLGVHEPWSLDEAPA